MPYHHHRADPRAETPSITAPWPTKDIVYVAIVGGVMLAAFLEWILWLLAVLYCLCKVYMKAEGPGKWSIRVLALLNGVFFIAMRCVFLPIMIVTLPLPAQITQYFPQRMTGVLQSFAFYAFAGLLLVPWLFCVYQLVTHNVGRRRRVKTVLDEYSAPKVVIIMPVYNEEPEVLLRTIKSIVDCDYPPSCMHIFLSFDGDAVNDLFLQTMEKLGVPLTLDFARCPSIDVTYRDSRVTVSRFPWGGKRHCQKRTFKLIDKIYAEYLRRNDNLFLLFIDSDCILDKVCIQNFIYEMELKPGSKRNMLAMTGVITSTTTKNSLITVLQDMEYIHGQLFERSVESGCGAVTCLPGALTILRFSAFRRMAKYYFADKAEQCDDLFDYGKCHLGEDRWLTHLFMIGAQERYQIQMNTGAFCKTEAVQKFQSLLKQRRRWFLGFITNEVCMLTDIRLWKRYPLLVIMRLAQNTIRTTALLFFIMVISLVSTEATIHSLPVGFIGVSLGLNWILMLYFGAKLGRWKITMYPLMFIVNPFMNWLYMVYGIFTAGQRTWGGPRADAGKADENTTPAEAIKQAAQAGDELNVVPETFKAYDHGHHVPLLPSEHLQGRFAPPELLPGGFFQQTNDSGALYPDMTPRDLEAMLHGKEARRDSYDSEGTIRTPRRVESLYAPTNSARMSGEGLYGPPPSVRLSGERGLSDLDRMVLAARHGPYGAFRTRASSAASLTTAGSDVSVSMHFAIPPRTTHAQPQATTQSRRHSTPPPPVQTLPRRNSFDAVPPPRQPSLDVPRTTRASSVGQSPLARKSFTRVASPPRDDDEAAPVMSAAEVIELEREMGRGRQPGPAERRRRKLSKQKGGNGGGGESSRGSSRG